MTAPSILYAAMHEKVGAEVVDESIKGKQLLISLRIKKGSPTTMWLAIVEHLLVLASQELATHKPQWTIDISKHYFLKPDLKYTWRVIIKSDNLESHYEKLAKAILATKLQVTPTEITEIPLYGNPNRRAGGLTGTVAVGPAAVPRT